MILVVFERDGLLLYLAQISLMKSIRMQKRKQSIIQGDICKLILCQMQGD